MATYRELLSRKTLSFEELWEEFLDQEIQVGAELKQAATHLAQYHCTPETKTAFMKKVREEILGWKTKD